MTTRPAKKGRNTEPPTWLACVVFADAAETDGFCVFVNIEPGHSGGGLFRLTRRKGVHAHPGTTVQVIAHAYRVVRLQELSDLLEDGQLLQDVGWQAVPPDIDPTALDAEHRWAMTATYGANVLSLVVYTVPDEPFRAPRVPSLDDRLSSAYDEENEHPFRDNEESLDLTLPLLRYRSTGFVLDDVAGLR